MTAHKLRIGLGILAGMALLAAGPVRKRGQAPALLDSTYHLSASRVGDTVTAVIHWTRPEKDRADVRIDVLDFDDKLHKTYSQRVKLSPGQDARLRFVINPRHLGLDSNRVYYAVSSNLACNCEDLYTAVLAAPPETYELPDPGLHLAVRRSGKAVYLVAFAQNLAKDVRIIAPKHPTWQLEERRFDLLPGLERELEIVGLQKGDYPQAEDFEAEYLQ